MSKKVKISFLIMIWGIVGFQSYLNWTQQNDNRVVEAFSRQQDEEVMVKAYAYLGTTTISRQQKEKLLQKLAKELNIETNNQVTESQKNRYEQWSLQTDTEDTVLQVISLYDSVKEKEKKENYLFIELSPKGGWEQGMKLYAHIRDLLDEMGVSGNVNVEKEMEHIGDLQNNRKKRDTFIKEILEQENAVMVDEMDAAGFFSAYGYKEGEPYITNLNGKHVNVQIVMDYSETDKKTYIKIGCPIVNSIY